jgi:tetratricopeptide (TPR) repeat protein
MKKGDNKMRRYWAMFLFMLTGISSFAQISFHIDAPRVVEVDESFRVVFISNADPSSFDPPAIAGFDILAGPTSSRMSSTQIINGKRTESFEVSYTYILQAKNPGKFSIPPASIVVDGKKYSSQSFSIEVVKGSGGGIGSNDVMLRLSLSKSRVVKGEPLQATLKLYTKVPISGFEDVKFPSFNGFWSQEIDTPQNIEFVRENVNGTIYNAAVLRRYMLIPQQTGAIQIDPSEMVCIVQVQAQSTAPRSIFDDFFSDYQTIKKRVTAPASRLSVDPLPAGAPASFNGAVGEFKMEASFTRDSLNANEALSLIIKISGTGNINLVEAPKVEFPADFEKYDTKTTERSTRGGSGSSGVKEFEYPLIPRGPGEFKIAPIKFSYYDIAKRSYITLSSGELLVKVGRDAGGNATYSGQMVPAGVNRQAVRSLGDDVRYIKTGASGLTKGNPLFFGTLSYLLILMAIAFAWFIIRTILDKHIERSKDIAGVKNRRAEKVAKGRLKVAETLLKQNIYSAFYEELYKALLGYASDKFSLSPADLSREKIKAALDRAAVEEQVSNEFLNLMDACEFARYSPNPGGGEMENNFKRAMKLITSLEGRKVGKGGVRMKSLLTLMAIIAVNALYGSEALDHRELWNSGNEKYMQGEFSTALESYLKIEEMGYNSPKLMYNIGNTYFKLGENGKAILYFERAVRLDPSDGDAERNLALANEFALDKIESVPEFILTTWLRDIRYIMSSNGWAWLSIVFAALFAFLMLFFRYATTSRMRKISFFGGTAALFLGLTSLLFAWNLKSDFTDHNSAIIMKPVSSIKSSPDNSGKTLFILHEGTKVKVLEQIGGWQRVELSDGRQGWVTSVDMEII